MSELTLPDGWIKVAFSNVTSKCQQKKPSINNLFTYIDIGSINRDTKKIIDPKVILGRDAPSRARKVVNTGDVLVSLTRPNLNAVALIDTKYHDQVASTGFEVLRPVLVNSNFIYYTVQSLDFINKISKKVQGALYPAAKSSDVQSYKFGLPPLAEQNEIARLVEQHLSQVDQIKAHLEAIPKLLTTFRQSVLADAVSGKLTEDWRNNNNPTNSFHDSKCLKSFRAEALVELPENWLWLPFSSIADIASNLTDPKLTPKVIHLAPNHIEKSTGRVIEISTIEKDNVKSAKHRFSKGQIVYSKIRPYLCKVVIADFDGLCSADMYPINSKINSKYLFFWMLSPKFTHWASNAESRVILPKINQKDLNKIPTPTPPLEEQNEIVSRVEELFAFADNIERQVQSATEHVNLLTQSILVKAFCGELTADWRKQNPEIISGDNSAEALLAKIQAQMKSSKAKTKAMN